MSGSELSGSDDLNWGPSGRVVYERTYSRTKLDGQKETWPETVVRVVDGNLRLVDRDDLLLPGERDDLIRLMTDMKIIPAGRQLWMSGVPGRQFLFNCHVSGWTKDVEDHFSFTFLRLMEGGGVGSNYSSTNMGYYPVSREVQVYIVCDPSHPDYAQMEAEGLLTDEFSPDWTGSIEVEDSREGWDNALRDLLRAAMGRTRHAKRVYDLSRVRWRGARIKSFGGTASGPLPLARMLLNIGGILNKRWNSVKEPFMSPGPKQEITPLDAMEIDHEIATCVVSGGNRRSARMSILHWNDPWIHEFLRCKEDTSKHWTTNISVEIDQEFIDHVSRQPAVYKNSVGGTSVHFSSDEQEHAHHVYRLIVEGMLKNGEPGVWNSTLSNADEPGYVEATNPCGEITLQAWENCNLGHVNLDAFAPPADYVSWRMGEKLAWWDQLHHAHKLMARFLIRSTYGDIRDDRQQEVVMRNRRIGVGHFGFAGLIAKRGMKFSRAHSTPWVTELLQGLYRTVSGAADEYAYELRIPSPVKLTTIAPTGSIAKLPGRTEGAHPPYAKYFIRRIRFSSIVENERLQLEALENEGFYSEKDLYSRDTWVVEIPTMESLVDEVNVLGYDGDGVVESVDEISLEDMLAVQAMYQEHYADNAVSFTVNVAPDRYTVEEVQEILLPYLSLLKGTTIFPDLSRPQSPYQRISKEEYEASVARRTDSSVDDECSSGACPIR